MMFRTIFLLLAALIPFRNFAQLPSLTPDQWRADLDFLVRKLEKAGKALYGNAPESLLKQADDLQNRIPAMEPDAILAEMSRLTASLNDGHTELDLFQAKAGFKRVPLSLRYFGKDLYILAAAKENRDLVGKKILKIGGMIVEEALKKVAPVLAHDNEVEWYYAAPNIFVLPALLHRLGVGNDAEKIAYELDDGQMIALNAIPPKEYQDLNWINAGAQTGAPQPLYLKNTGRYYWYEYLPESRILYLQFNRVANQKGQPSFKQFIAGMFRQIDRIRPDKMVIDLRFNNGGNYHISRPLLKALKKRPWLSQKGNIFAVTGPRTFSAGMVTAVFLKREANGILAGERCRSKPNGSDNNENGTLPNSGLRFSYTTRIKDRWPDMGEAKYVEVDLPAENTMADYRLGNDRIFDLIASLH